MPIYEYTCNNCGKRFELIKSISQVNAQTFCPNCSSDQVKRLPSLVNAFSSGIGLSPSSNSCSSCSSSSCSTCGNK
ncbi:MAG: zinc ribbon domain-containing protein [Anaerolineaceae bacterium]